MSGSQLLLLGGVPAAVPVDPYFYSVTSLLHGDGTNGGQNNTFLDSSTNNFTITRNGNTTQGSFSPFSQTGWSNYFDGTGDYLVTPSNAALSSTLLGSDFTIETWLYLTAAPSGGAAIWTNSVSNSDGFSSSYVTTNLAIGTGKVGVNEFATANNILALNQWNHFACVRNGATVYIYVNGTQVASGAASTYLNTSATKPMTFGSSYQTSPAAISGYFSNIRVVSSAVYTANFTPPTVPLTAISNTQLLTCQSNRFIDNSTNAFTITRNGDVSVQPFSPFNPTTAYSTSSIGGSGYFDGSGDYLTTSPNAAFRPSGNFTIEAWVYLSTVSGIQNFFTTQDGSGFYQFSLGTNGTNARFTMGPYSGAYAVAINGGTLTTGAWFHIAVARSGTGSNNIRMWVNGSSVAQATSNATPGTETSVEIGREAFGGSNPFTGYMSGLRIVTGSAVYDPTQSTITVPTSPLTAVTNTSFLLNFTNGAIFDNAAVADYETVGNAQISTSVKKYGTGSMSFDGTGDYLVTDAPSTDLFAFGTGDFTIEFWLYLNSTSGTPMIYDGRPSLTNGAQPTIYMNGAVITYYTNAANRITGSSLSTSTWYHVALCRVASQTRMFVNGTQVGATYADTTAYTNTAGRPVYGVDGNSGNTNYLNGYIDDLRISKGVGRYAYNFTPPTAEFPNIGGTVTLTADPYYEYTTLLLPGNGTNGAQNNTFLDSSTNAFTITRNGNATQGTFSPFSQTGWGNYFPGTSGSYLSFANNSALNIGSGDFTAECWIYPTAKNNSTIFYKGPVTGPTYDYFLGWDGATLTIVYGGTTSATMTDTTQLNSWNHIALVRNTANNTIRVYINGTQAFSATYTGTYASTSGGAIGGTPGLSNTYAFSGYISNVRFGQSAVYTSNFTPSTTPLTAISGTSLLTCQSNRFIDNSTNAFTITRNGDVSVQAFSPFNPTASWSAATYGGSGYFDGSGDYLTATLTSQAPGTGDFTYQFWVYAADNTAVSLFDTRAVNNNTTGFTLLINGTSNLAIYTNSTILTGSGTVPLNAWSFVTVTRSGTTLTIYLNGTSQGTVTFSNNLTDTAMRLGQYVDGTGSFTGYIAGFKYVKGSADSASVPTTPPTATTGTQFLCNFTNAGIYDATSKNDLETVGNAQISTTQSKFGGSSMYFDGNGDWLASVATAFGTFNAGDFTVECWIYSTVNQNSALIVGNRTSAVDTVWALEFYNNGTGNNILNWHSGTTIIMYANTAASINTWNHVAVVRFGTALKMYLNGREVASATDSRNYSSVTPIQVGYESFAGTSGIGYYNGYINDLRITKGIARYTSNFTPPTTAFLTL